MRSSPSIVFLALPLLGAHGCGSSAPDAKPMDASVRLDARVADARPQDDAIAPLGWVDFSISGCARGDGSEASPCLGASPLVLRFGALSPAQIDTQIWNFGDGSNPETRATPEHRFSRPGSYDISLNVDGPGGTAGRVRLAAVVVIPAPLGGPCRISSQCASGDCECPESSACPAPLDEGICMLQCQSDADCGANHCIDLSSTNASAAGPWRRLTCLPSCESSEEFCGPNASCQTLLDVDGRLTRACFVTGLLVPIGGSCRNEAGNLDHSLCASGQCLDFGLRGICSANCANLVCPSETTCVTPLSGNADPMCAANCESSPCDLDPLISCQLPSENFSIEGPSSTAGYCTPNFP